ncbi:heavy-metal-associated domain-containing protein [Cellulomonas sp. NPDC089187]|uniref:heavy-metal-associated domain-containing protein n=1 Tax=Cellulomonas sp. NPDC089187 TaxID=3154970 RepID=UPI0034230632
MTTTTFSVDGMTCGNCVKHVTEELTALPGVQDVRIDLVAGGSSPVTVTSTAPLDDAAIAEAVDEAGYAVTPKGSLV